MLRRGYYPQRKSFAVPALSQHKAAPTRARVAVRGGLNLRQKKKGISFEMPFIHGGSCRIRTYDQLVKSQLLYQLS